MKTSIAVTATPETRSNREATHKTSRWRWPGIALWIAIALVTAVIYLQPVRSQSVWAELLIGAAMLWAGALIIIRHKGFRVIGVLIPLLAAGVLLLPGRHINPVELRSEYWRALMNYRGTPYIWGGETRRGIDCSGLIRAGFVTAQWRHGLTTFNSALMRSAISLAWHDASARAMRDAYRGDTRLLFRADSIEKIDNTKLLPGDFAVTEDGIHSLAYIGKGHWIEAEPGDKVITLPATADNGWLKMPVHVLRWRHLEAR